MSRILSAHRVLEYALTKAAVSAKLTKTTLRIPYKELLHSIGQSTDKEIDLVLTIDTAWDETSRFANLDEDSLNLEESED
jgi:hypothetical protein